PPLLFFTPSLHDALPIFIWWRRSLDRTTWDVSLKTMMQASRLRGLILCGKSSHAGPQWRIKRSPSCNFKRHRGNCSEWKQSPTRSEEHTSELQSRSDLVC